MHRIVKQLLAKSFGGLWFLGFRIRRLPSNDLTGRDVEKTQALVALICRIMQKQGERDCAIKREVERTEATAQFYCSIAITKVQRDNLIPMGRESRGKGHRGVVGSGRGKLKIKYPLCHGGMQHTRQRRQAQR